MKTLMIRRVLTEAECRPFHCSGTTAACGSLLMLNFMVQAADPQRYIAIQTVQRLAPRKLFRRLAKTDCKELQVLFLLEKECIGHVGAAHIAGAHGLLVLESQHM